MYSFPHFQPVLVQFELTMLDFTLDSYLIQYGLPDTPRAIARLASILTYQNLGGSTNILPGLQKYLEASIL